MADRNYRSTETTINGIRVELTLFEEGGEPRSYCDLSKTTANGEHYSGSLALCEAEGGIPYDHGGDNNGPERYTVSARTFERIYEWAEANGY